MGSGLLFKVVPNLCEFVGMRSDGEWATIKVVLVLCEFVGMRSDGEWVTI